MVYNITSNTLTSPASRMYLFAAAMIAFLVVVSPHFAIAKSGQSLLAQQLFNAYQRNAVGGVSGTDFRYLKDNRIQVPAGLTQAQQGGLHNVIGDKKLQNAADRNERLAIYLTSAAAQDGIAAAREKLYIVCTFYPQANGCDKVYQFALAHPADRAATTLKSTFEGYARYLKKSGTLLTDADRRFLRLTISKSPQD